MLELLKSSQKGPSVYCHEHEHKEVEFYCRKHDELLCSLCVWDHSDHRGLVKVCTQKEVKHHTDSISKALDSMKEHIVDKIERGRQMLYNIENKEKQMSSKDIIESLQFVKDLLIQPYYHDENEGRRLKYVIDMKDNFLGGSLIIKNLKDSDLLREYLDTSYCVTELVYRASQDGFQAASFHSKVDGKGAVICLI